MPETSPITTASALCVLGSDSTDYFLAGILDHAAVAIIVADLQGRLMRVNDASCRLLGMKPDELLGKNIESLIHPEDVSQHAQAFQDLAEGRISGYNVEKRYRRKDGAFIAVRNSVSLVQDAAGRAQYVLRIIEDRSVVREATSALERSERLLRAIVDNVPVGLAMAEAPGGRILFSNQRLKEILGDRLGDTADICSASCDDEQHGRQHNDPFLRALRTSHRQRSEHLHPREDGSTTWVEITSCPVHDQAGAIRGTVVAVSDIDLQRKTEEALRESEARCRTLIDAQPAVVWLADSDGKLQYLSERFREFTGLEPHPPLGERWREVIHPEDLPRAWQQWQNAVRSGGRFDTQYRVRSQDGSYRWCITRALPQFHSNGEVQRWIGLTSDIDDQKRAEQIAVSSERRYRSLAESLPHLVCSGFVRNGGEVSWQFGNSRLRSFLGDLVLWCSESWIELVHPDDQSTLSQAINRCARSSQSRSGTFRFRRADNAWIWHEYHLASLSDDEGEIRLTCTMSDISGRMRTEEQQQQAAKLEAVGRLAGGIAHDFNNLLMIISANAELLSFDDQTTEVAKRIDDIRCASSRAANLTQQLLGFSRKQIQTLKVIEINQAIEDTTKMMRRLIPENVTLSLDLGPKNFVNVDINQLSQVMINLCVNAVDAMPNGGALTVATQQLAVRGTATRHPLPVGKYSVISVQDTGIGILPEQKPHIFEPFFTTKEKGKGTGLGLATVYGIVKQLNGFVFVDSVSGQGSCFSIYLPLSANAPGFEAPERPTQACPHGLRFLVVEDEELLRKVIADYLIAEGNHVTTARDGEEATAALQSGSLFDVVITDVVMPRKGGRDLVLEAAVFAPDAKLLFISGYTDDQLLRQGLRLGEFALLQKPFAMSELAHTLRALCS